VTYENKLNKFVKQSHRGIAGIIVSLILIAVAVVGGISVFMFTQGFISDTSVTAPTIDVIEIFGYDSRDSVNLFSHTGVAINNINTVASEDSVLGDGDAFALYLRNRGHTIIAISSIEVYGTSYTISTLPDCVADTVPANGEFSISFDGALDSCGEIDIVSGQEVTIYVRYDISTNGNVPLGRPIPVTVITGNGMEISKQLTNGALDWWN